MVNIKLIATELFQPRASEGDPISIIQWKPDITMYQGTGEITSLYRGIVKPGFRSIHFSVTGIGRAEKC